MVLIMTVLSDFVASHPLSTDAEIATALNALTVRKTDSTRYTSAKVGRLLTPDFFGYVDDIMSTTPGTGWISRLLAGAGVDFSDPDTQETLDKLEPLLGDAIVALKSIGTWYVSQWVDAGREGIATANDVAAIRADILATAARDHASQKAATAWNEVVEPAITQGKTWGEIKALIAEAE